MHTVTPSLVFKDCVKALAFYEKAFGAKSSSCLTLPNGKIGHAEIRIGDSIVFCADEWPDFPIKSPESLQGGVSSGLYLHIDDCDAWHQRAVSAGAKSVMQPQNQFYGQRCSLVRDPFGYYWTLASIIEELSEAEIEKRGKEWFKSMAAAKK